MDLRRPRTGKGSGGARAHWQSLTQPCRDAQPTITRCSAFTPSVSAAGPGCRMIDDFTSCSSPSRTAATPAQPGRSATERGQQNFSGLGSLFNSSSASEAEGLRNMLLQDLDKSQ